MKSREKLLMQKISKREKIKKKLSKKASNGDVVEEPSNEIEHAVKRKISENGEHGRIWWNLPFCFIVLI